MKKFDFKKYVEFKVYSVTTIKKGYGFRVLLKFADGSDTTQQHAGFCSKREANAQRDEIIGQLHAGTYIVYGKIKVADFMEFWLEEIMRPRIADNSYNGYKNVVYNYVNPQLGKMYMATLNQGYIRKLYNSIAEKYESIARLAKTVMNTALDYAKSKNVIAVNPAEGVPLPKKIKKKPYRELKIDVSKTLTLPQVFQLVEASKATPIHMQILFAVLMGLRRGEINGLKYSDVDYINRTLKIQRQLGKKPNSKAEDVPPKMLTKQEIKPKTPSSIREIPIPDYVFEAILEQAGSSWSLTLPSIAVRGSRTYPDGSTAYFCTIQTGDYDVRGEEIVDQGARSFRVVVTLKGSGEDTVWTDVRTVEEWETVSVLEELGMDELAQLAQAGEALPVVWQMPEGNELLADYCQGAGLSLTTAGSSSKFS